MSKNLHNDQKIWYASMDTAEHLRVWAKKVTSIELNRQKSLYGMEFGCLNDVKTMETEKENNMPPK